MTRYRSIPLSLLALLFIVIGLSPGCATDRAESGTAVEVGQPSAGGPAAPAISVGNLPAVSIEAGAIPLGQLRIHEHPTADQANELEGQLRDGVELPGPQLFVSGSAELQPEVMTALQRLAPQLVTMLGEGESLTVEGYVDETGTAEANRFLALDRATAVREALVEAAPELDRWIGEPIGHGEDELLHPECRGDCQANRVVIIRLG